MPDNNDQGYLPDVYQRLRADHPEVLAAYSSLAEACRAVGGLTDREQRLVKLGIAVGLSSEGAVRSHVRRALEEGITERDVIQAILLAVPTTGFPTSVAAYQWAREVMDAERRS